MRSAIIVRRGLLSYLKKLVGTQIRTLRGQLKWSQAELAAFLEVEPATVSRWESGLNMPDAERLEALAKRAEVPPTFFFHDVDLMPIQRPIPALSQKHKHELVVRWAKERFGDLLDPSDYSPAMQTTLVQVLERGIHLGIDAALEASESAPLLKAAEPHPKRRR